MKKARCLKLLAVILTRHLITALQDEAFHIEKIYVFLSGSLSLTINALDFKRGLMKRAGPRLPLYFFDKASRQAGIKSSISKVKMVLTRSRSRI